MPDGPGRYLGLAAECRALADSALSEEVRQRWLTLADTWLSIHDQVIELAQLEKRDARRSGESDPLGRSRDGDNDDGNRRH